MERYWVPSSAKSAVFGTDLMDYWFPVSQGGDIAFLYGVLKVLVANNWLNHEFIRDHTVDFDKLKQHVNELPFDLLEKQSAFRERTCRSSPNSSATRRTPCSFGAWASRNTPSAATPSR